MGAHGDGRIYEQIRDMSNALAPQSRAISPASQVFVSFQVDDAWDLRPFPHVEVDQFAMVEEFDVDAVGLSSYPGFFFSDPSEIPADYYRRFLAVAGRKPLIQVEGGWPSTSVAMGAGTEAKQAAYFRKLFQLLDSVEAELVVALLFADLAIDDPRWPITPELRESLRNFGSMGIVNANYTAKHAAVAWDAEFRRPILP